MCHMRQSERDCVTGGNVSQGPGSCSNRDYKLVRQIEACYCGCRLPKNYVSESPILKVRSKQIRSVNVGYGPRNCKPLETILAMHVLVLRTSTYKALKTLQWLDHFYFYRESTQLITRSS